MIIIKNREMLMPDEEQTLGTNYDMDSENRVFRVNRFLQGGVDVSAFTFRLDLKYEAGDYDTLVLDQKEITENYVYLTWTIQHSTLQQPGTLWASIRAIDDEATVRWSSFITPFWVERHLNTPANYTGDLTEIEQIEQDHVYMKGVIDELKDNLDYRKDAEAWAVGQRDGVDVPTTDITWHNNAKYYARYAGETGVAQMADRMDAHESAIGEIQSDIATVEATDYASKAYSVGDYLMTKDGVLCRVTQAIASGAQIIIGTNVTPTSITNELKNGYVETWSPVTGITFYRIGRIVTLRINNFTVTATTSWSTIFNGILTRFLPMSATYTIPCYVPPAASRFATARITGTEIQYVGTETSLYGNATYIAQEDAGDTPSTVNTYALSISQGSNSTITVQRTSSPRKGAALGTLSNNAAIYTGDVLKITFGTPSGYELTTHTVNGSTFTSGNVIVVNSNVTVVSAARQTRVNKPTLNGPFIFDDTTKTVTVSGFISSAMTQSGTVSAKNEGTYTVTWTLKSGYAWSDGTTAPYSATWQIIWEEGTSHYSNDIYDRGWKKDSKLTWYTGNGNSWKATWGSDSIDYSQCNHGTSDTQFGAITYGNNATEDLKGKTIHISFTNRDERSWSVRLGYRAIADNLYQGNSVMSAELPKQSTRVFSATLPETYSRPITFTCAFGSGSKASCDVSINRIWIT